MHRIAAQADEWLCRWCIATCLQQLQALGELLKEGGLGAELDLCRCLHLQLAQVPRLARPPVLDLRRPKSKHDGGPAGSRQRCRNGLKVIRWLARLLPCLHLHKLHPAPRSLAAIHGPSQWPRFAVLHQLDRSLYRLQRQQKQRCRCLVTVCQRQRLGCMGPQPRNDKRTLTSPRLTDADCFLLPLPFVGLLLLGSALPNPREHCTPCTGGARPSLPRAGRDRRCMCSCDAIQMDNSSKGKGTSEQDRLRLGLM